MCKKGSPELKYVEFIQRVKLLDNVYIFKEEKGIFSLQ